MLSLTDYLPFIQYFRVRFHGSSMESRQMNDYERLVGSISVGKFNDIIRRPLVQP